MERIEAARKWYWGWKDKPSTRAALKRFMAIGGNDTRNIAITQERIALACFDAAHYQPELDPGQIYRDEIRAEKKRLSQLAKAAHVFAMSAARNEKGLMWACAKAESTSGVRITRKEPSPMALNLVVKNYFSHLETALKGKLPELHGGSWLHRFTIGNLTSDKAISRGRPVTAETMLAFELAFYLRMHTADRAEDGLQNGQSMPVDGEPCFSVVTAFCIAVFDGKKFTKRDIQDKVKRTSDNVRKLKNVGLTDWPRVINSTSNNGN